LAQARRSRSQSARLRAGPPAAVAEFVPIDLAINMKSGLWASTSILIASTFPLESAAFLGSYGPFDWPEVEIVPGGPLRHGPNGTRPKIMDTFSSNILVEGAGPMAFPKTNGTLVYDAPSHRYALLAEYEFPAFDHVRQNMSRIAVGDTMMMAIRHGCMNWTGLGMAFDSLFQVFVSVANYTGKSEVRGRSCDMWTISGQKMVGKVSNNMTLCIDGDKPLEMRRSDMIITLLDFSPRIDPSSFDAPPQCLTTPAPCGDGKIVNQTVFLAHPRKVFNISGQDVADSKGDAVFLCEDRFMWQAGGYELFSAFEITMVRNYTFYANYPPPGGRGFGGDQFHVGREAPLFVGDHWGQCEDDAHWHQRLGQWLSLPPAGQCIGERKSLGEDCMWRIERRVATVEMDCVMRERNFLDQCKDAKAPFTEVEQILLNSLATEDAAQGGCPRFREPECQSHPACSQQEGDCCPRADGSMHECCNAAASPDYAVESILI